LQSFWSIILYFSILGFIQFVLGSLFNCGNHIDPASQGCPLPNSFNHNSVLHIFQLLAMAAYFAAEILAIRHRMRFSEKIELSM